jgi:hypothetical protein
MEFWLIQHLLIVTALAGAAWVCERWGRLSPAAMHLVWLVVLIKFMTPPLIHWPTDRLTTWIEPLFRADDPAADSQRTTVKPTVEFKESSPLLSDETGLVGDETTLEISESESRDEEFVIVSVPSPAVVIDKAPEAASNQDASVDFEPSRSTPIVADLAMADREPATSSAPEDPIPAAIAPLSAQTEPTPHAFIRCSGCGRSGWQVRWFAGRCAGDAFANGMSSSLAVVRPAKSCVHDWSRGVGS